MSEPEAQRIVQRSAVSLLNFTAHAPKDWTKHYSVGVGGDSVSGQRASEVRVTFTLTTCGRGRCRGFVVSATEVTVTPRKAKELPVTFVWDESGPAPTERVDFFKGHLLKGVRLSELEQLEPPSEVVRFIRQQGELPVHQPAFKAAERMKCARCDDPIEPDDSFSAKEKRDHSWRLAHVNCPKDLPW